ncbi:hypothetical protein U1708_07795 [Sphingomonas sp. ZB1N12]|uniref:hypothetical protein n=1 Tax=Sphingomonas arabinosi TaxID=3096160 RepID=UPI002FC6CC40
MTFIRKHSTSMICFGTCILMFATYELVPSRELDHPPRTGQTTIKVIDSPEIISGAKTLQASRVLTAEDQIQSSFLPTDTTATTKDAAIKAAEMRLPASWDVTKNFHDKLKVERRDESWASSTEQNLIAASQNLQSLKVLSANSTLYCAATICEMTITAAQFSSTDSLNLMTNDLQSSQFDQVLTDHGLSLASISMAGGDQDHRGIVMQIKKN